MKKINLRDADPSLSPPDLSHLYLKDLKYFVSRVKERDGVDFHLSNTLGYVMIYYAIELCYEFQIRGYGSVPENIKQSVIDQVFKASEKFVRMDDDLKQTIRTKFNIVISNDAIVDEAIQYLDDLRP